MQGHASAWTSRGRVLVLVLGWSLRTGAEAEAGKRFLPGKGRALNAVLGCLDFYPSGEEQSRFWVGCDRAVFH